MPRQCWKPRYRSFERQRLATLSKLRARSPLAANAASKCFNRSWASVMACCSALPSNNLSRSLGENIVNKSAQVS